MPVILPDKEQWEVDYEELDAYLKQFGRDYPKELGYKAGPNVEAGESWVTNYEEILGKLIDGASKQPLSVVVFGKFWQFEQVLMYSIHFHLRRVSHHFWYAFHFVIRLGYEQKRNSRRWDTLPLRVRPRRMLVEKSKRWTVG